MIEEEEEEEVQRCKVYINTFAWTWSSIKVVGHLHW